MKIRKNLQPTGLITGIVLGALAMFAVQQINFNTKLAASLLPGNAGTACNLGQMPTSDPILGLISTEQEYNAAITSYQESHPINVMGTTYGGSIGKNHLMAILNSLPSEATEVNFKFITNTSNSKTSIYFKGGNLNPVSGIAGTGSLYVRTGTAADAFCPSRCN